MADSPLRIDFVITELFVGGAERCLTELAIGLKARGDTVRVASIGSLPGGNRATLVQRLREAGIEVDSARCDSSRRALGAYRWLYRWFQDGRPDVVQTMLFHANVLGTWAARAAGVPRCVGGLRVAEKIRWRLMVERQAARRMDSLVCVSRSVEHFAHQVLGRHLPPTHVIGNAIDCDGIDRITPVDWAEFGWPGDARVLLFVGRLHHQKGLDILMQAIQPLFGAEGDPRAIRCLLVGDGPQRQQLAAVASQLGPHRLQLAGWRADSLALIKACHLLVLPSRYEGMPNVILEAMAAGKAVAACDVEGVRELLGGGADAQTCPPGDTAALRALIQRLWNDAAATRTLGQQNRNRARQHHQIDSLVDRYRSIYTG